MKPSTGADGRDINHVNDNRVVTSECENALVRPQPKKPPDPGPHIQLHCSMSPTATDTPCPQSQTPSPEWRDWNESEIREACRGMERGNRVDVKWRYADTTLNSQASGYTWRGTITRIGRGSSIEYDGEISWVNGHAHYERWETHTVAGILPNADISVCDICRVTHQAAKQSANSSVKKAPTEPVRDITTDTHPLVISKLRASAPSFAMPALPRVQATPTPAAPPHDGPALHIPPAVFNPIEWDDIFATPDAAANIRPDENTEAAALQGAPEPEAEHMDATDDDSDDDSGSVDEVEEEVRFWTPPMPDIDTNNEPQHDTRGRQAAAGRVACTTARPRPLGNPPGSIPLPTARSRRARADYHERPQEGPLEAPRNAHGPAQCPSGPGLHRVDQSTPTKPRMEMDHHDDDDGATARSTSIATDLRTYARSNDGAHLSQAFGGVANGDEIMPEKSQRGMWATTEGCDRGAAKAGAAKHNNQRSDKSSNPGELGDSSQMRRHAETETLRPRDAGHKADDNMGQRKDSSATGCIHGAHRDSAGILRAAARTPGCMRSDGNGANLPQHQRPTNQSGSADGRPPTGAEKPTSRLSPDASCPRHEAGGTAALQRTCNGEDATPIPGPRQVGQGTGKLDAGSCANGLRHGVSEPKTTQRATDVDKLLANVGRKAATAADLGMQTKKSAKDAAALPILMKPVVGACDWELLERLSMAESVAAELTEAKFWRSNKSKNYDMVSRILNGDNTSLRNEQKHMIPKEDAKAYLEGKKLRMLREGEPAPKAWCNFFSRPEWEKIPPRRRGLIEPLINDAIKSWAGFNTSVKYTSTQEIRWLVLQHEYGATADMSAWFDQHKQYATDFFGIRDDEGLTYVVEVVATGYIPSCKIAQAALAAIAPWPPVPQALFVDNAAFYGTATKAAEAMKSFKMRAGSCGAVINDEDNSPRQQYEFLGESYDHVAKTRQLTKKSLVKLTRIAALLVALPANKGKTTCRLAMAIYGTLLYAGEVLDVPLAKWRTALKHFADISAEAGRLQSWDHKVILGTEVISELTAWTEKCIENKPVHVVRGNKPEKNNKAATTTMYVDASAWGWGAVVISEQNTVRHISQQWNQMDAAEVAAQGGHLGSSVFAEPLAVRRALCAIQITPENAVQIWTDHMSVVAAAERRYSVVPSYNAVLELRENLATVGVHISLAFIPGKDNPADALSRGKPPLLMVTSIGRG